MRLHLEDATSVSVPSSALTAAQLNLALRPARSNALPWRGQFNPELVENLLRHYGHAASRVCDPFAGSGTVLFEAAALGMESFGSEVNPAAYELAFLACFSGLPVSVRLESVKEAHNLARRGLPTPEAVGEAAAQVASEWTRSLLTTGLLLTMRHGHKFDEEVFADRLKSVAELVSNLPARPIRTELCLGDARDLPIGEDSIDLILTSPPYVNVFNYHHNYRPAVEVLGWDVLAAARSEIGSNRKNRGNRFLTVIEYSLEMLQALTEMLRVLRADGRVILIVGRESRVLGAPIRNSEIVLKLIDRCIGATLESCNERVFQNRFGEMIYEDVLVVRSDPGGVATVDLEAAREIGVEELLTAREECAEDRRSVLDAAVRRAAEVRPSPIVRGQ
jgi:hypothetical protein